MTDLRQAFEETHYIVHHRQPFTLRIGQQSHELDSLLQDVGRDCAAFITAWNPMSQPLSRAENLKRQQCLIDEVKGFDLPIVPGIGQHPSDSWPGEESILVLGLQVESSRALEKSFEQLALVWVKKGYPIELIET